MLNRILMATFKGSRKLFYSLYYPITSKITKLYFYCNGVETGVIQSWGVPYIFILRSSTISIGSPLYLNNGIERCESGLLSRCRIRVLDGAKLTIGNYVGMSGVTISCRKEITIGDNVQLGVGVHIYDTDFHSMSAEHRRDPHLDRINAIQKPVVIKNDAFIGAHSLILKGVTIGTHAIVGAGSVVTKNVPDYEIWAGNPARFIKKLEKI